MRRLVFKSAIVALATLYVLPASAKHLAVGGHFFKHAPFGTYRCVVKYLPSGVVINACVKKQE